MTAVEQAIEQAERVLPSVAANDGEIDPRWQAIIRVAEFVESNPDELWAFAHRWGATSDEDLRQAIATCLLEHLLEHHFAALFPRVADAARADTNFAATTLACWPLGQSAETSNAARFHELRAQLVAAARH